MRSGFTLLELLIVLAIMGFLAAMAAPNYQHLVRRVRFQEVVQAVTPYRLAVESCYLWAGALEECSSGAGGIPVTFMGQESDLLLKVEVAAGAIIATPREKHGFSHMDTYVLTPEADSNGQLRWRATGGAVEKGWVSGVS